MKIVAIDNEAWQEGRGYRKQRLLAAGALRQPGALVQVVRLAPGAHVPPHSHATSVEVYIVTRGACELVAGGQTHQMRPGDILLMEPGDVHELTNHGPEPFELLVFKTNAHDADTLWAAPDLTGGWLH